MKTKFIFMIDAERHYNILIRIMATFNRQRIPIIELSSQLENEKGQLKVTVAFEEHRDRAIKLSRRLDREIDIISVNLFEQLN